MSVSRSIFALVDDRDRAYFGRETHARDQVGYIEPNTRAIFGRSYAAEPNRYQGLMDDFAAKRASYVA